MTERMLAIAAGVLAVLVLGLGLVRTVVAEQAAGTGDADGRTAVRPSAVVRLDVALLSLIGVLVVLLGAVLALGLHNG